MKRINGHTRVFGKMIPYCIEIKDCYEIVKRDGGWSIKKDGEFIDDYRYGTKWVAASKLANTLKSKITACSGVFLVWWYNLSTDIEKCHHDALK